MSLAKDFLRIKISLSPVPLSGRLCGVERLWKDNGTVPGACGGGARGRNGGVRAGDVGVLRLRDVPRAVAGAVRADFAAWVERNFFNARAGRIGDISYTRAGELDDAVPESGPRKGRREARHLWYAEAYDRALVDHMEPLRAEEADFLFHHPHMALQLMLGVTDLRGLRCLRRGLTHEVDRLQRRACRARYYVRDNARRRALAAERRRITRRTTTNPCPTPDTLRAAFAARGESPEAKIRLGGLLEDLECYVDNCLRLGPDGEVLGRNGGVKAWLREHVPELFVYYKTLMRYKSLARRLRQAAGVYDPVPVDVLLPSVSYPHLSASEPMDAPPALTVVSSSRMPLPNGAFQGEVAGAKWPPTEHVYTQDGMSLRRSVVAKRARRTVEGILRDCPNTFAALFRAVDAALG